MNTLPAINIQPKTFFSQDLSLPALPKLLTQIKEAIDSEEVGIKEIAGLINKDAGLVAQILKMVNSAYYSVSKKIQDARLAVAYIGME